METGDVLRMLFERGNAMQSFWGFYISLSLGVIAFFGSSQRSTRLAILISIAFIGFAIVNCGGMTKIARERKEIFKLLEPKATAEAEVGSATAPSVPNIAALVRVSEPPEPLGVAAFHVAADIGVLAAIWILTLKP